MDKKDNFISFDVNETLYFERGQEINEMLSISLDPDISLEMFDAYVQIRGIILLHGAYKKSQEHSHDSHEETVTAHIEKITDRNDEEAEFSHRFPLDISIPRERVHQLDDVSVMIHAFDYELPDHQTLKIKATIHIIGIYDEMASGESEEIAKDEQQKEVIQDVNIEEANESLTQQTEPSETAEKVNREHDMIIDAEDRAGDVETSNLEEDHASEIDISLKNLKNKQRMMK